MGAPGDPRILVVEDDDSLRDVLAMSLGLNGYSILSAPGGHAASELLQSHPVDVVVSDIRMAHGNGVELLDWVRARDPRRPVLIFLTGFSDYPEKELLGRGAFRVLKKPFQLEELIHTVDLAIQASVAGRA